MFPRNFKNHQLKTRKCEKYKVNFAHTTRLQNSSIIYMQKLLNEHEAMINQNQKLTNTYHDHSFLLTVNFCVYFSCEVTVSLCTHYITDNKPSLSLSSRFQRHHICFSDGKICQSVLFIIHKTVVGMMGEVSCFRKSLWMNE